MKRYLTFLVIIIIVCIVGVQKNKLVPNEIIIDKNVNSLTLLNNLEQYINYKDTLNKTLNLTFSFKKGVNIPDNPPVVIVKVYLWMNDDLVGIYHKTLYNSYEDYLYPIKLEFDADGKKFNKYNVMFEGNTKYIINIGGGKEEIQL